MPQQSPAPTVGATAYWTAAARARESERPDRLFEDRWAAALAGDRGRAALAASEAASGGENPFLPIRTRFFDDLIEGEASRLDQVVLLGAGLDTRAFRLALPPDLGWFELDAEGLLADKARMLDELGLEARCRRIAVATDFAAAWQDALISAGLELGRRTAWVAEGLLFYLDESLVRRLLAGCRDLSGSGSWFGGDLFGTGLLAVPAMQAYLAARADRGLEPPFANDDPAGLVKAAGWPTVTIELPGRLAVAYGRSARPASAPIVHPSSTTQSYLVVARREE